MLDTCREQLTDAGIRPELRTVLADSGYASEENFARADADGLRLLAPLAKDPGKDQGRRRGRAPRRTRHLDQYPATARAVRRLRHHRGKEDYKLRARTVEPVFGQLKTCQELSTMSRRGHTACESEWLLACAARNLRKLHRHRLEGKGSTKAPAQQPGPKNAQDRNLAPCLRSNIPRTSPCTALCDRLRYARG